MNPTEIMTIDRGNGGELSLSRPAETVLKEAQMVAKPWGAAVEKLVLYKMIGPSKHLYIEAWQMLGAMYRCTARVISTNYIQFGDIVGFEARAELYHMPTGQVISTADAQCLNDEENWGPRPKYDWQTPEGGGKSVKVQIGTVLTPLQQLRSMAQTRAMSKVFSNSFKWVARMQGYQGTPAEEMTGGEEGATAPHAGNGGPQRKSAGAPGATVGSNGGPDFISEQQSKRMFAIAMGEAKLSKEEYVQFLKQRGFETSRDVTKDKYDGVISALQELGRQSGGGQ